jgi:outer membrane protein assembly factor BamB
MRWACFSLWAFLASCAANSQTPIVTEARTAKVEASASPPADETVDYQANVQHTGYVAGTLRPPLTQVWADNFGGLRGSAGYPVVANGMVVLPANNDLIALSAKTGRVFWTKPPPKGGSGWNAVASDDGRIFASPFYTHGKRNLGIFAFDERTGKRLWAADTVGQYAISAPPAAGSGMVYVSAAGFGGSVYAFGEVNGALKWTASVKGGDDSSPVISPKGIYVSYTCPQAYDLSPKGGKQIWYYDGPCYGGGGSTPSLYDGLLFVEDSQALSGYNGVIFAANTGVVAGGFNSYATPAFAHKLGFFVTSGSTLEAVRIPSIARAWTANLSNSDSYSTPPLVVGNTVFIETQAGELFGYDYRTGRNIVAMNLGYGSGYQGPSAGLGFGSNMLFVPRGSELIALKGS